MSKSSTVKFNNGGSLCGAMFLVFMTLKLIHQIDWSWWWVTAPLWGPVALFAGMFVAGMVGCLLFLALRGIIRALDDVGKRRELERRKMRMAPGADAALRTGDSIIEDLTAAPVSNSRVGPLKKYGLY